MGWNFQTATGTLSWDSVDWVMGSLKQASGLTWPKGKDMAMPSNHKIHYQYFIWICYDLVAWAITYSLIEYSWIYLDALLLKEHKTIPSSLASHFNHDILILFWCSFKQSTNALVLHILHNPPVSLLSKHYQNLQTHTQTRTHIHLRAVLPFNLETLHEKETPPLADPGHVHLKEMWMTSRTFSP